VSTRICHMVARSWEEWAPVCATRTRRRGPCQPGGAGVPDGAGGAGADAGADAGAPSGPGFRAPPGPRGAQGRSPPPGALAGARTDAWTARPGDIAPVQAAGRGGGRLCGCSSPIVRPARQWAARGGTCSPERPINRRRVQLPSRPSPRTASPARPWPGGGGSVRRSGRAAGATVARVCPPPRSCPRAPGAHHLL
jgi:hypothetical protein